MRTGRCSFYFEALFKELLQDEFGAFAASRLNLRLIEGAAQEICSCRVVEVGRMACAAHRCKKCG